MEVFNTIYKSLRLKLEIKAVYLPTAPKFHKDYSMKYLEAGKIPYTENPMALTYGECLEMIEKSKSTKFNEKFVYYR